MRTKVLSLVVTALILTAFACRLPTVSVPTQEPQVLDTAVAQTVQAELTAQAPTDTPPSEATETPSPEPTATPVDTSTPLTSSPVPDTPTSPPAATEPPTDTPIPQSTHTSTPVCSIGMASGFASRLEAHPGVLLALGCPTNEPQESWAAEQRFQIGRMFWQQDTLVIHIVYDNGAYQTVADRWEEGDSEQPCPEQGPPPASLVMPKRGFGWHWCYTPGVREKLGWALDEEVGYETVWQAFEYGRVLQSHLNEIFVFYNDGTWDYIR